MKISECLKTSENQRSHTVFLMLRGTSSQGCGCCPEAFECLEEVQEKLRGQLRGLGLSGEGDPCRWEGIECRDCAVPEKSALTNSGMLLMTPMFPTTGVCVR